jgi:hypothetical protein
MKEQEACCQKYELKISSSLKRKKERKRETFSYEAVNKKDSLHV